MSGMIIIPFELLVKITTPRLELADPAMNALKSPLSPQCQKNGPRAVCSIPTPSPHEIVSDVFVIGRPMQFEHPASTCDCAVNMARLVSFFSPGPFLTAIANVA